MKSTRLQTHLALRQHTDGQVVIASGGFLLAGSNAGELSTRQLRRLAQRSSKRTNEKAAIGVAAFSKNKGKTKA